MESSSFRNHLTADLIPFWNGCMDAEKGGFCGHVDYDLRRDWQSDKGVILHSRILWFYSNAYLLLRDVSLREMADHAYEFLTQSCLDREQGGMFWSVTASGQPKDTVKHTYAQAFAVYALSAYYEASNREEALQNAYGLYALIEEKCRDGEGYLEAFERDFTPAANDKLSENGVLAERTMNTLLHVMEAYTELYRVDGDPGVRERLCEILDIFMEKIYCPGKRSCEVFFDKEYHSLIDLESFGHNIEASWLLERADEVLRDERYTEKIAAVSAGVAEAAYEHAFEGDGHGMKNEREGERVDSQKIWWVQAEAVVGFYNAYRHLGEDKYLEAARSVWNFVREYMTDRRCGEWFEAVREDGSIDSDRGPAHAWKGPYHNGRMCMEMIRRLEGWSAPSNPRHTGEAAELLALLYDTAGRGIITGQHTQTNGMEEIDYIRAVTGKAPMLQGFELLAYSPNINREESGEECLREVDENRLTMDTALRWAKESGGIVTLTFHWFSPIGGRDKSFYAKNTDFDAEKILREGTEEREAFYRDLDVIATQLTRFADAGIPVLWRPFHEADGDWFWWGAKGSRVARQLYRMMYDYYLEKGLNNLLWVWSCSAVEGYPGDSRVDVVAADVYRDSYEATDYGGEYERLIRANGRHKVAALGEVGYLPDVRRLEDSHMPWAYYMTWSKEFCIGDRYNKAEQLRKMYESDYARTL
ncbi:MAG: AGE family epimerase/isomerase [Bacteroides sp.]|nr:AGE family epimerase/isomerase [Bacteroides sp.]